jgi:N-acyl amino acid synthase FeeM
VLISSARRLVARRYLDEGYVKPADIGGAGVLTEWADPYHDDSAYFVAVDPASGEVVATIRQIHFNPGLGLGSFPFFAHLELWDETWFLAAEDGAAKHFVELSGLAKEPWVESGAANRLYREMWIRSFSQGHEYWLIATHPRFARWLKGLFMTSVREAGPVIQYMGSETSPLLMSVSQALDGVCERYFSTTSERVRARCRATAAYFLDGVDGTNFTPAQVARFTDMGLEVSLDLRDHVLTARET